MTEPGSKAEENRQLEARLAQFQREFDEFNSNLAQEKKGGESRKVHI